MYACVPAWSIASDQAGVASRASLFSFLGFETSGRWNRDEPDLRNARIPQTIPVHILAFDILKIHFNTIHLPAFDDLSSFQGFGLKCW